MNDEQTLVWWKQVKWKGIDDQRNEFCQGFYIYEHAKVLWFGNIEEIVCNRDDLILNALFDFKPVKRLEYCGDMKMFASAINGTCKSILNVLKAFNLSDG